MWKRLDKGLWSLSCWIPNYSVNSVTWEKGFSPPKSISRLGNRMMVAKVGRGPKGLLNCYWKKSGKLTRKRLCKMNSTITQVHVVLSNSNKMSCLYHHKNLQPTLLTRTVISQESFSPFPCKAPGSPKAVNRERLPPNMAIYMCVFCAFPLVSQIESADACLILANKYCADPDAEDASNIMR